MITCHRLFSATEVIDNWFFFRKGLTTIEKTNVDLTQMLKVCCTLATEPKKGFVAIVYQDKIPTGFGIMEDVSPIFAKEHTFLCRAFWHQSGNVGATNFLIEFFEDWARTNQVKSYTVTTKRDSGALMRCFKSQKYGFRRSYTTFVKDLS